MGCGSELSGDARPFERGARARRSSSRRQRRSRREVDRLGGIHDVPGDLFRRRLRAAGLPDLRRALVRPGDEADRAALAEAARRAAGTAPAAGRAGTARVRDALPADLAAGDGQGRRGHGASTATCGSLALNEVGGDPVALRHRRSPSSTRRTPARGNASRTPARRRRRTTRSARATCGRGSARWPGWPRAGRARARAGSVNAAAPRRRARRGRASTSSSRRSSAPGRSRASGCRGLPREGAARGEAQHNWVDAGPGATRRAVKRFAPRSADHRAVPRRLRAVRWRASPRPASARRSASCC